MLKKLSGFVYGNITVALLSFASLAVSARSLGPENYGQATLLLVLITAFSAALQFGVNNILIREVAQSPDVDADLNLLYLIAPIKILFLLIAMIFAYIFGEPIQRMLGIKVLDDVLFALGCLHIFLLELVVFMDGYLVAKGLLKKSIFINIMAAVLRVLLLLIWPPSTVFQFFIILCLPTIVVLIIHAFYLTTIRNVSFQIDGKKLKNLVTKNFIFSKATTGTKLAYAFWERAPLFILERLLTPTEVGYIALAYNIAARYRAFGATLSKVHLAVMSKELERSSSKYDINPFKFSYSVLTSFAVVPIFAVFFFGESIFSLIAGEGYSQASAFGFYFFVINFLFLQINWIGSGILYPSNAVAFLSLFHLVTKSAVLVLIYLISVFALSAEPHLSLSILIAADFCTVYFYFRRAKLIGLSVLSNYIVSIHFTILAFLLTMAFH